MTESGSPKTLVFATGNSNKKEEIAALIGSETELKDLRDLGVIEDIPETEPPCTKTPVSKHNISGIDSVFLCLQTTRVWKQQL